MEFTPGALETSASIGERAIWSALVRELHGSRGTCGYKIPSVGVPDPSDIPSFVIVTDQAGVVLIDVVDDRVAGPASEDFWALDSGEQIYSRDIILDSFESEVANRCRQDTKLYDRHSPSLSLRFPIVKLLIFYRNTRAELDGQLGALGLVNKSAASDDWPIHVRNILNDDEFDPVSQDAYDRIIASIDGTNALLPKRHRSAVTKPVTKRDFLDLSRAQIFKLDEEQRQISLQLPNGPQRIRGLAGTGKTVILSLKAALTHKTQPSFRILYLFNTKSLYGLVRGYINKYFIPEAKREPDWSKLEIFHAWGGKGQRGLYSYLCDLHGVPPKTFDDLRGSPNNLQFLFRSILEEIGNRLSPIYDVVLIDEAQDFPPELFEVVYKITADPKRIVWAYDEFQTLSETRIREPEELFGLNAMGQPNISSADLAGDYSETVKKDFVLPNSYRTSRVNLMTAHGLALGIRNKTGFIDIIDNRQSWEALGYDVIEPQKDSFVEGDRLKVTRPETHSRNILERTLRDYNFPDRDLISYVPSFPSSEDEIDYVAGRIQEAITRDGVVPEEIIAITLDTAKSRPKLTALRQRLSARNISSIMPGFFEGGDIFSERGSVTLVTPFRAKGNEADVVFVMDTQRAAQDFSFRARNFLFVSITRARGWCYISGNGPRANEIFEEIDGILQTYPYFNFNFPNDHDIQRRRVILSLPDSEARKAREDLESLVRANPEILQEFLRQNPGFFRDAENHGA